MSVGGSIFSSLQYGRFFIRDSLSNIDLNIVYSTFSRPIVETKLMVEILLKYSYLSRWSCMALHKATETIWRM